LPTEIRLPDVVGGGYGAFWRFRGRYRVVKGSRASKKSKTAALWFIYNLMKHPGANLLVVRKTFRTLKDSCFAELKWAAARLQVAALWRATESPMEMTYLPTGQKIFFRGLDDPLKVTSIAAERGALCWMWIEEAYEIAREEDFDVLDESIRGQAPPGCFKQITLTFNPWNEKHWLKRRFFDAPESPDVLAMTTNYLCNEWLDEADRRVFTEMKARNPRRYRVAGLGDWGIVEGLVYENFREMDFNVRAEAFQRLHPGLHSCCGLDFGFTNDPTAAFIGFVDADTRQIFVWDELYEKALSNRKIAQRLSAMGYAKESFIADSASPKDIEELRNEYRLRVRPSAKGADSVLHGVQWIQDYEIVIHPRCVHFLTEISNYTWDADKFGNRINRPIDGFNHLMDAMRYGLEPYSRPGGIRILK
jgi:phage terminase large subunit